MRRRPRPPLAAFLVLGAVLTAALMGGSAVLARPAQSQPVFLFPWPGDQQWHFSTGPHYGTGPDSGIDFAPPWSYSSRPVLALAGGTVKWVQYGPGGLGWTAAIDHGGGWETWYSHLAAQPYVRPGQRVPQGQYVGEAGCSGNCNGLHVHVELIKDGRPLSWDGMVVDGWTVRGGSGGGYLARGGDVVWDAGYIGYTRPLASSNVRRDGCPPTPTPTPAPARHPLAQNAPFRASAPGVAGGAPPPPAPALPPGC